MGTYISTAVTLDTVFWFPYRDIYSDSTFFVGRCSGGSTSIHIIAECRYRKTVSFLGIYLHLNIVDEFHYVFSAVFCMGCCQSFISGVLPAFWNLDFFHLFCTGIDGIIVHLHNGIAFSAVGSFCCSFHQVNGLFFRNDIGQFKESRLEYSVDAAAQTDVFSNADTVNHIELNSMICNKCFYLSGKVLFQTCHIPWTVQKECSAVHQLLHHIVLIYIRRIVAGHEIRFMDQICGLNGLFTKSQMRHGHTAGLLGIIIKICLGIHICVITDDLNGVFVGTHSTVGTQSPELAVDGSFRRGYQRSAGFQ